MYVTSKKRKKEKNKRKKETKATAKMKVLVIEILRQFLAAEIESEVAKQTRGRLLLVQATFFEYGGMAIGISISNQ